MIHFYLFHSRIRQKNIAMLSSLCRKCENIYFQEIRVPDPEAYLKIAEYGGSWTSEAYYSLCAHTLLPESVNRILYLDAGDTLVLGDIEPYYNYDFQDNYLIATASRYKLDPNGEITFLNESDLADRAEHLPGILRGVFNSGSYLLNLDAMRRDHLSLDDYQNLVTELRKIYPNKNNIYWGDQGLLSTAFVGSIRYYGFPEIRNIYYMPYNFCLWYYDRMKDKPDYSPAILHYAGTAFKPWQGAYPIFLERFQKKESLHPLSELKLGQAEYFYLWHEYAILTDRILKKLGY